jgi:hypothetical protein
VVKGFLSQLGIAYTLRDLNADGAARGEFLRLGFRLPPVVVVNGVAVQGFQPERLEAVLEEAGAFDEA